MASASIVSEPVSANPASAASGTALRVLLVDDHTILREGLRLLIDAQPDMAVVAEARGGREAARLAETLQPDVVVLDVSMPDLGGPDAAARILEVCPGTRILALTRHADHGYLQRMLRCGASGYVLKKTASEALIGAIRVVASGGTHIDPGLAAGLVARALGGPASRAPGVGGAPLSEREEQVLRLIAWGRSNKEVAAQLGISVKTAEYYKAAALEKLQIRTRTDILRYALSQRWLVDDDGTPE